MTIYPSATLSTAALFCLRFDNHATRQTRQTSDILRRCWLYVDIDRDKTNAPHECATDEEKQQVRRLAEEVIAFLTLHGLPRPIIIDSGNGMHLLWRVDLPNDGASSKLIKDFLLALNGRFGAQIDTCVHDARRIIRMPGTVNAKGSGTPDRPHRLARIPEAPAETRNTIIPAEVLQRIIDSEMPVPTLVSGPASAPASKTFFGEADATPNQGTPVHDRPGDDFIARASWGEILVPHGWRRFRDSGDKVEWTRPGKDDGCSATTGYCTTEKSGDLFYVFSGSAPPFEPNKGYSKFAVYAILNHNGVYRAAASALAAQGFGKRRTKRRTDGPDLEGGIIEALDDPDRLARLYLQTRWTTDAGEQTLRLWRQDWMAWNGTIYRTIPNDEIENGVHRAIKEEFDRAHKKLCEIGKARPLLPR